MKKYLLFLVLFFTSISVSARDLRAYSSNYDPKTNITYFNFDSNYWSADFKKGEEIRIYKHSENEPDIAWVWFATANGGLEITVKDHRAMKVTGVKKEGDKLILPSYSDYLSNKNQSKPQEIDAKKIEDPEQTKIPKISDTNAALNAGMTAGVTTAASMIIYRSFIMSYSEQKAIEKLNAQTQNNIKKTRELYGQIDQASADAMIAAGNSAAHMMGTSMNQAFDVNNIRFDNYVYKSPESDFKNRVIEARGMLNSIQTKTADDAVKKQIGLETTEAADEAYADGQKGEAEYLLDIALQIGDMLVGWDPVTGTARSFVQAVWGRDPFSGEKLSDLERAFAFLGVVTGGYGSKVLMGFKTIQKIASRIDQLGESAKYGAKLYELYLKENSPGARKFFNELRDAYERYKHGLQGSIFTDPKKIRRLVKHVNKAWSNIDSHVLEAAHADALTSDMRYAYRHPSPEMLKGFDDPSKVQQVWLDKGTIMYRVEGVHNSDTFGKVHRKSPLHVEEIERIQAKYPNAVIKYYVLPADTPMAAGKALGGEVVQYKMPFKKDLIDQAVKEIPFDDLDVVD